MNFRRRMASILLLAGFLGVAGGVGAYGNGSLPGIPVAQARESRGGGDAGEVAGSVDRSTLPREAQQVLDTIYSGGSFRYEKDGIVFGNRERALPREPRGYYHEYTVPTPRARTRGARRIVCGGAPRKPDACYYTNDHYSTFKRIQG